MAKDICNKIKCTAFIGTLFQGDERRFDDKNYFNEENFYHYRLSKVKFFLGEKNKKELILGLQAIYLTPLCKEIPGEEARDKSVKELDIKVLEIPPNDFLCHLYVWRGDDRITQIKLVTKKGKSLTVGSKEGEEVKIDFLNNKKCDDFMILYFFGAYRKCLECIAAGYVPIKEYVKNTMGYFMLKKKVKTNEKFRNRIEENLKKFKSDDQVLYRVCQLPDNCFNSIIKYCFL